MLFQSHPNGVLVLVPCAITLAVLSAPTLLDLVLPLGPLLAVLALMVIFNLLASRRPDGDSASVADIARQLAVDLVAMGVMLYESLTGRSAHKGEGRLELLEARSKPPPPLAVHSPATPGPMISERP